MIDARELTKALATEREPRVYRRCIYCSAHCYGLACRAHRDLLLTDPRTYELRLKGS